MIAPHVYGSSVIFVSTVAIPPHVASSVFWDDTMYGSLLKLIKEFAVTDGRYMHKDGKCTTRVAMVINFFRTIEYPSRWMLSD